jgi:hypothetical protein
MKSLIAAALLIACTGPLSADVDDSLRAAAAPRPGWGIVIDAACIGLGDRVRAGVGLAWNIDGRDEIAVTLNENEEFGCENDEFGWISSGEFRELGWRLQYRRMLAAQGACTFFASAYVFESFWFSDRLRLADIPRSLSLRDGDIGCGAGPGVSLFPFPNVEVAASYAFEWSRSRDAHTECGYTTDTRALSSVVNFHFILQL